jgi:phenylalanyl-tRNA synthetase beta subunit
MSEICIKKELEYSLGLFRIGAVIMPNEEETWKDNKVKPICAEDDFMLHFKKKGSQGVHVGKKHFKSILEAEAYISFLVINGFSILDL